MKRVRILERTMQAIVIRIIMCFSQPPSSLSCVDDVSSLVDPSVLQCDAGPQPIRRINSDFGANPLEQLERMSQETSLFEPPMVGNIILANIC